MGQLNVEKIRKDFLALDQKIKGKTLVYLDSAATSLKPKSVTQRIEHFYNFEAANIHRGIHSLSIQATAAYEEVRDKIATFIEAKDRSEIIFTTGATDAINLVAHSYGEPFLASGDEILISEMEHHSNLVPWQILCERKGCVLKYIPVNLKGELIIEDFYKSLNEKTKFVSITHCSNTLGTINPIKDIIRAAHEKGALVMVDAAQSIPSLSISVTELDCDFLAFSGHKIFGPFGVGVLYGKRFHLERMPPYRTGGGMISEVHWMKSTYNEPPFRFEAGTPPIAEVVALGAAIDYVTQLGIHKIKNYKDDLVKQATSALKEIKGLKIIGEAHHKSSVVSFVIQGFHPNDIGEILNQEGIAVRTGHHCTQPLLHKLGLTSVIRTSYSIYNHYEDIDRLIKGIHKAIKLLT